MLFMSNGEEDSHEANMGTLTKVCLILRYKH